MIRDHIREARFRLECAQQAITAETEYLRDELHALEEYFDILFAKMYRDDILRRDRDALHAGMLENVGEPDAQTGD